MRAKPAANESAAPIQKTIFHDSVEPPTPKLAQAASTYPMEYPCWRIPDIKPLKYVSMCFDVKSECCALTEHQPGSSQEPWQ